MGGLGGTSGSPETWQAGQDSSCCPSPIQGDTLWGTHFRILGFFFRGANWHSMLPAPGDFVVFW